MIYRKGDQALHKRGLVHQDLHEENVLLDISPQGCKAVLIDFGLTVRADQARDFWLQGASVKCPPEGLMMKLPVV